MAIKVKVQPQQKQQPVVAEPSDWYRRLVTRLHRNREAVVAYAILFFGLALRVFRRTAVR